MKYLATEIAAFDGKHTDTLEALAARIRPNRSTLNELCALAGQEEPRLQVAATWLLKRFQSDGLSFSPAQVEKILDLFDSVTDWEARLHLLQILPGLAVPAARKGALYEILISEDCLNNDAKFVRAWSYNALAALATQHPEFRPEVARRLAAAEGEETASVRARIRNIRKRATWAAQV